MILQPCYELLKTNESVLLAQTKSSAVYQDKNYEGDAKVCLDLVPRAGIHIHISMPSLPKPPSELGLKILTIGNNDIPGFVIYEDMINDFIWCPSQELVAGRGHNNTTINSVIFHIFNYKELICKRRSVEHDGNASAAIFHVDIRAAGWDIEIKSMVSTFTTFKSLREKGGYGLTHIGCLKKEDRSNFDGKRAEDMLSALRYFLSFTKGIWCDPCLAVGFDDKDNRVWEKWSSPKGNWAFPLSWFDPHHCEQLTNLFPGFIAKWENEDWREALQEVIYWYLSSNCSTLGLGIGIDAGIILTQAAIERLSFEYAVRQRKLIEAEGFKNLRASDKFRLLFSSLDIPLDMHSSLPNLQKYAKKFHWIDAPQAITEIRNSLVHPEHKQRGKFNEAFFPAWNLGQLYLELALLKICDYSGTYGNRLSSRWVGQVETVPWDKNSGKIDVSANR